MPATGLASQIFSFTSMICSTVAVNSPCQATSRRTFSTSAGASCRPTVPLPGRSGSTATSARARDDRGAHAQLDLPHLR